MTAKKYEVFHPDHEVSAHLMLQMRDAINSENFSMLFDERGLSTVNAEDWVLTQDFLDIFNDLSDRGTTTYDFVSIGMKLMESAQYPPEIENQPFADFFKYPTYDMFNRGTDPGDVIAEELADRHIVWKVRTPYPDDFWYGVMYAQARRFIPKDTTWIVKYDAEMRREQGSERTFIHIQWDDEA